VLAFLTTIKGVSRCGEGKGKGKGKGKGGRRTALARPARGVILVVAEVVGLEGDQAEQRGAFTGGCDAVGLEGGVEGLGGLIGGTAFVGVRCVGAGAGFRGDLEDLGGCEGCGRGSGSGVGV